MANHNHDPSSSIIDENEKSPKGVSRRVAVVGGAATALGLILAACGKKKPEANESSTPAEPLNEDFKGSPNNVETAPAEPHYVESGIDPNKIYGATEISTAIPGEQALMIGEMLVQWDPSLEDLVAGYYPKTNQETGEIEIVTLGSDPDKKHSIEDCMDKDHTILLMTLAMCQDPDPSVRKTGAAILDTLVDGAIPVADLTAYEDNKNTESGVYAGETSTEALISGSMLVEAIKQYPTNPEKLEEIAPWINKDITLKACSDSYRRLNDPEDRRFFVRVVVITGSYIDDATNMERTVSFVVQSRNVLKDEGIANVGQVYNGINVSNADQTTNNQLMAFENVPIGSEPKLNPMSTGLVHPEDNWPYNK